MEILKIINIRKRYGEQQVLNGISFNIETGKIYLFKGPSGCGKSTLLNICSFLENADEGDILYNGISVATFNENQKKALLRSDVGYIFQDYNLFEDLSVFDNLRLYLISISNLNESEISSVISEKLDAVGLSHKSDTITKFLSGGERQRLTLARTLLIPKKIIFADEPSANIDIDNVCELKKIFIKLKEQNTALLIVTHDSAFDDIADHIFEISGGLLK